MHLIIASQRHAKIRKKLRPLLASFNALKTPSLQVLKARLDAARKVSKFSGFHAMLSRWRSTGDGAGHVHAITQSRNHAIKSTAPCRVVNLQQ